MHVCGPAPNVSPDAPGSATWVVQAGGSWWVAFAHYAGRGGEPGTGPEHARLVTLDADFRSLASYAYPPELVARFAGRSNSGGVGADAACGRRAAAPSIAASRRCAAALRSSRIRRNVSSSPKRSRLP